MILEAVKLALVATKGINSSKEIYNRETLNYEIQQMSFKAPYHPMPLK